jgi:hypothetical protein
MAKSSDSNTRALRRAAKRHNSLATATLFIVATIGFCDVFLYYKVSYVILLMIE